MPCDNDSEGTGKKALLLSVAMGMPAGVDGADNAGGADCVANVDNDADIDAPPFWGGDNFSGQSVVAHSCQCSTPYLIQLQACFCCWSS